MREADYLRDMALFVEVGRTKSFTRAAEALGIPTSSLSRRIGDLETSVGLKLLRRSTRMVDLTEAGALYLSRCESIIEAAREAHAEVRDLVANPQGLLRISVEAEIGPRLVAPVVAEFLQRYPRTTIDLDLSPRRVDLLSENFDLAIRIGDLKDSALTARRLAHMHSGLYAAPAYLERNGAPSHPDELVRHARIRLLHRDDRGEWVLRKGDETRVIDTPALASANNMTMLRQLVRLGLGIARLDDFIARSDAAAGLLQPVLTEWTLAKVPISLITPSRVLPAKTRLFFEMLTHRISGVVGLEPPEAV